jgi:branched-subunit amino acid aminotransferase/4-amino-4-deoxychorismate lyase
VTTHVEINGVPATAAQLALAASAYGHFSTMQVRDGAVRGLSLHVQRLQEATERLFGGVLDGEALRAWLRAALERAGRWESASVRFVIASSAFDRERPEVACAADVLIFVSPPIERQPRPLRVQLCRYARELPEIKHLATFGQLWQRRQARLAGYDDALFEDAQGRISEGSVWNIGFWDGSAVTWPEAAMLDGISQRVLDDGFARCGVARRSAAIRAVDLARYTAAFTCNANGVGAPIASIDGHAFAPQPGITELLLRCYASVPAEPI